MLTVKTGGYDRQQVQTLMELLLDGKASICSKANHFCANCTNKTVCRDIERAVTHLVEVLTNPEQYILRNDIKRGYRKKPLDNNTKV